MTDERRRWPRFPSELLIYYRAVTDLESAVMPSSNQAKTRNVSRKGFGIRLDEYISAGTLIKTDLVLPQKSKIISAYCKVVWINKCSDEKHFEAGLEIVDIEDEDQRAFADFLSKNFSPAEYGG